jgi:hypothetical protein
VADDRRREVRLGLTPRQGRRLLLGLLWLDLALVAIHVSLALVLVPRGGHVPYMFHLDEERNLPTWLESSELLLTGLCLMATAQRMTPGGRPRGRFFLVAGAAFAVLSLDEASLLHETIDKYLREVISRFTSVGDVDLWVFLYGFVGMVLLALGARNIPAVWRRFRGPSLWLVAGLAGASLGGVIVEAISSNSLMDDKTTLAYHIAVAVEECLELAGVSIALYGAWLFATFHEGQRAPGRLEQEPQDRSPAPGAQAGGCG